ncbi:VIT1/CCC1 transporter family protein [Jatrophihabitans endophyticus]|uniref:VIT1/CCC1 transporter family protein n=1 Tax=Jatrophihabitans endophyticus TaxID=1206085 RepID=UPI0026ECEDF2|nr:VIT1/CCC1 transporter family protein [Jatrophihabitans endophyticus]
MTETTRDTDSAEIHHEHRDVAGGWLRPTVFGMMDGLVSNFALIAGVAGASADRTAVSLAGLAGLVGGAFSMATGEYVSVASQNESTAAEVAVERHELDVNASAELAELTELYVSRGVDRPLAEQVAEQLSRDPDQALKIHALEELGVDPHSLPSPWTAAFSSLCAFAFGALIPLLPFLCGVSGLWLPSLLAVVALFTAGAVAARWTSRNLLFSGTRQLVLGVVAAAVTYGVGTLFHATVG